MNSQPGTQPHLPRAGEVPRAAWGFPPPSSRVDIIVFIHKEAVRFFSGCSSDVSKSFIPPFVSRIHYSSSCLNPAPAFVHLQRAEPGVFQHLLWKSVTSADLRKADPLVPAQEGCLGRLRLSPIAFLQKLNSSQLTLP